MSYLKRQSARRAPQRRPATGLDAGFKQRRRLQLAGRRLGAARRFLILGSRGRQLLRRRVGADARERRGGRALPRGRWRPHGRARSSTVSEAGRAAEERPGVFALALAAAAGDEATRKAALDALPRVCRTSTHLFQFAGVRRGVPWLGPLASPRRRRLVRGPFGRGSPTRRSSTGSAKAGQPPRPAAARAPGGPGQRRQPDPRAHGRAPGPVRVDRSRRRRRGTAAASSRATTLAQSRTTAERVRRQLIREYGLPREAVPTRS